jgi:hypothetical protein
MKNNPYRITQEELKNHIEKCYNSFKHKTTHYNQTDKLSIGFLDRLWTVSENELRRTDPISTLEEKYSIDDEGIYLERMVELFWDNLRYSLDVIGHTQICATYAYNNDRWGLILNFPGLCSDEFSKFNFSKDLITNKIKRAIACHSSKEQDYKDFYSCIRISWDFKYPTGEYVDLAEKKYFLVSEEEAMMSFASDLCMQNQNTVDFIMNIEYGIREHNLYSYSIFSCSPKGGISTSDKYLTFELIETEEKLKSQEHVKRCFDTTVGKNNILGVAVIALSYAPTNTPEYKVYKTFLLRHKDELAISIANILSWKSHLYNWRIGFVSLDGNTWGIDMETFINMVKYEQTRN